MAINNSRTGFGEYNTQNVLENMSSTDSIVAKAIGGSGSNFFERFHLFDGFTGISQSGIEQLSNNLLSYVAELQAIVDGYNENANLNNALAAESKAAEAAKKFIGDIKVLIQAYVSTIKVYAETATKAYENWSNSDTSIGSDVETSGSDIRQAAENLSLD